MILRITQNVRDKIKVKVPTTEPASKPPLFLFEWYANLVTVDRKSYFLFCEATTLYSVVKPSRWISDRVAFERLATDVLFEQFKLNGNLDIRVFEKLALSVTLLKTNNRRLIGSMNEQTLFAQIRGDEEGEGFDFLNSNILSYLNYDRPRDAFAKAIASVTLTGY